MKFFRTTSTAFGLGVALGLALLSAEGARADTRMASGRGLILDARKLQSTTTIEVDPALGDSIRVTADDSCLTVISTGGNVVVNADQCGSDIGTVSIALPAGAAVTIAGNGNGDIHIGGQIVMLTGDMTGDGDLTAGRITGPLTLAVHANCNSTIEELDGPATLDLAASGDVRLRTLRGPLRVKQNGSGELAIGAIQAPAADISMFGSGDTTIGHGDIAVLHAESHGSGDVSVGASVGTADLAGFGSGDIKLTKVSGMVRRATHGSGDITVGGSTVSGETIVVPPIPPIPPIPDITIDGESATGYSAHRSSNVGHFVAFMVVGGIAFAVWRTVQRAGGIATLRARFGAPSSQMAPTHPGVIALRDTMARLDARLARVESYVTNREFDLHRKFRELDTH